MRAPDPAHFAERLIELYGGREKAREALDARHRSFEAAWAPNIGRIGRIVRAHLVVEHFLTQYLVVRNPLMGSPDQARLTFAQKTALLGEGDPAIACYTPGIVRLNQIRNRLVHDLTAEVTPDDARVLLGVAPFRALREALHAGSSPSSDPLAVFEDFARHASVVFQHSASPDAALWAQALDGPEDG